MLWSGDCCRILLFFRHAQNWWSERICRSAVRGHARHFVVDVLVERFVSKKVSTNTRTEEEISTVVFSPLSSLRFLRLCLHCVRSFAARSTRYKV